MDPRIVSAGIGAGADILSSAFGGDSAAGARRDMRYQMKYQNRYFKKQNKYLRKLQAQYDYPREDSAIQRRVADAKAAGLHPLFAMGGQLGGGGGSPGVAAPPQGFIPGQSRSGSFARDAIQGAGKFLQEIVKIQAETNLAQARDIGPVPRGHPRPAAAPTKAPVRDPHARTAHPSESLPGSAVTSTGGEYVIPPGTPQSALEDEIGEWSDWMPDNMKRAAEIFQRQMRSITGAFGTIFDFYLWLARTNQAQTIPRDQRAKFVKLAKRGIDYRRRTSGHPRAFKYDWDTSA